MARASALAGLVRLVTIKPDLRAGAKRIKVTADKFQKVAEGLKALTDKRVYAGVPSTKAERQNDEAEGPINNAALMYIHEFGAPEANIPARPVVHPAIKKIQPALITEMKAGSKAALSGNPAATERMFHRMGALAMNAMRERITDGPFIPLSPKTLAARKAKRKSRKSTSIKPLIDTGQLRRALNYVVRKFKR